MKSLRMDRDADGVQVLRSKLLLEAGFQNAFSTTIGPDGTVFDVSSPDAERATVPPAVRSKNLTRFHRMFPGSPEVTTIRQVHGADVVFAGDGTLQGDGLVETRPHHVVGVRTADCVPILIADPGTGAVAAVHAGWRGLVADIVGRTIERLSDVVDDPSHLIAAIGPAIGPEAFEIGPEVAARFVEADLAEVLVRGHSRPHADLHRATRVRLLAAGIDPARIDGGPLCTHDDARFFSFRRSGQTAGSHLAAIQAGSNIELMPR